MFLVSRSGGARMTLVVLLFSAFIILVSRDNIGLCSVVRHLRAESWNRQSAGADGARVVSGKILRVTADPGDSIEDENFSRAGDRCLQCCNFLQDSFFATASRAAGFGNWRIRGHC